MSNAQVSKANLLLHSATKILSAVIAATSSYMFFDDGRRRVAELPQEGVARDVRYVPAPEVVVGQLLQQAGLHVLVERHEPLPRALVLLYEAEVSLDAVDEPHDGVLAHRGALLQLVAGDPRHGSVLDVQRELHQPLLQVAHDLHRPLVLVGHDAINLGLEEGQQWEPYPCSVI